jgi:hypothetical protein
MDSASPARLRAWIDCQLASPALDPPIRAEIQEAKAILDAPSTVTAVEVCRTLKTWGGFYAFEALRHAFNYLEEAGQAHDVELSKVNFDGNRPVELCELREQQRNQAQFAVVEAITDYLKFVAAPPAMITIRHDPCTVPEPAIVTLRMPERDR